MLPNHKPYTKINVWTQTFSTDQVFSYFILAGINNVHYSAAIGSCVLIIIMDIILGYCFDSQCLFECCPSSTTVDKKIQLKKKRKQQEILKNHFLWTFYKVYP